jgi:hypothetical protein
METLFQLSVLLVMPFWLLIVFLPHWRWTRRIMNSVLVVVPAALLFLFLLISNLALTLDFLARLFPPTLASIQPLLGSATGASIVWIHVGAFDLFVGRWVYLDSRMEGISAWLISPILAVAFLLGPLGFLLYLAARWRVSRSRSSPAPAQVTIA